MAAVKTATSYTAAFSALFYLCSKEGAEMLSNPPANALRLDSL